MKIAVRKKLQRAGLSAVAAAALLSATGCSYVGVTPVATAEVGYAPADGIVVTTGDLKVTNLLIVATDAGSPGRLLGSLTNVGDEDLTVTVAVDDATARIEVPAGSSLLLEDAEPVILDPAGTDPGLMAETEIRVGGETLVESVPVLDHTFPRYAEFVPGGAPSTPANPSNTPKAVEGHVGEGGGQEGQEATGH